MSAILMWKMESLELLPSQSPGGGKMSEAVTSSNIFKWTQLTGGHSMGIQTDPGDLYFRASLGQLCNSVCQLHSLKDSIHSLKNWIDSRSGWGTLLHWKNVGPRELVGRLWCVGMEKCRTQDIQSEVGDSQAPWGLYWSGKMSDPGALNQKWPTHSSCGAFISQLHWVSSTWLTHSVFGCAHLAPKKCIRFTVPLGTFILDVIS